MKNITAALLLLSTSFAFAKGEIVLVSDIDDTIKVSHVLDSDSAVRNAIATKNAFTGMPELYTKLKEEKSADKIIYLSNAPKFLMTGMHKRFIKRNGFPEGTLLLAKGLSNKNHKISSLREVIKTDEPKELILIGDNGERDAEIYAQIQKEYPNLKMTTFIHQVYSLGGYDNSIGKPVLDGQIAYVTTVDLAAHMKLKGLLSQKSYDGILQDIIPKALKEKDKVERGKNMIFPAWLDCRDYIPFALPTLNEDLEGLVQKFEERLTARCLIEPFAD